MGTLKSVGAGNPLKVGNIIRVSGSGIDVLLTSADMEIEHGERVYRIGQIGSYVTIPLHDQTIVAFVTSVGRKDVTTSDVEPDMVMSAQPLGTIRDGRFTRGVNEYPTIGDDVWVAVQDDFEKIFGSFDQLLAGSRHPKSFALGRFALNTDFQVKVLGKEFFSKNVAVLGNSGSGKSCTTAKILQEVVRLPESQVILFDLHGEYASAFSDENGKPDSNVTIVNDQDMVLPYWLLKYEELESLLVDRSNPLLESNQISFLKMALMRLRRQAAEELDIVKEYTIDTPIFFSLERLKTFAENMNDSRFVLGTERYAFSQLAQRSLRVEEQEELLAFKRCSFNAGDPQGEIPHPVFNGKLVGMINQLESRLNDRRYDFLLRPETQAKKSAIFRQAILPGATPGELSNAMRHILQLLLGQIEPRRNLTILDLSGIPADIVDITVALVTRLIFDYNFWSPTHMRHPVVLCFEEAHNYIPRADSRRRHFARKAVEKVAKEGRKYGVTAMVISQRPAELSETVLSQCNNMVVMRITNPDDQAFVRKVVSDQFSELVTLLPVLRPGEGFVIGDSVLMPLRTLIELPTRTPRSGDVDYFRHWSDERPNIDTRKILEYWWRQDRTLMNTSVPPPLAPSPPQAVTPHRPKTAVPPGVEDRLVPLTSGAGGAPPFDIGRRMQ
jgi:DNA helicase HerA-like ATPase